MSRQLDITKTIAELHPTRTVSHWKYYTYATEGHFLI